MAAGRTAAQAFITRLPNDLVAEEEELIDLLDRIGTVIAGFLPRAVTVQDWAEMRVPTTDVERVNASGLVHVQSKGIIESRVLVQSQAPAGSRSHKQQVPIGARASTTSTPATLEVASPVQVKRRRFNVKPFDIEAFLQELPENEFSPTEAALRVEIIKYMFRNLRKGVDSVVVGMLAEAAGVVIALEALSLPAAHLEDWMLHRAASEFLVSSNNHGDVVVELEKSVKFPHRGTAEHDHISETFFSSLPSESFSLQEQTLRDKICDFIDNFKGSGFPTLSTMGQDREVSAVRNALLPRGVSLKEWIETRCGEDFDLVLNLSNQNCIGHAGTLDKDVVAMSRMERQPGSSRYNSHRRMRGRGGRR